MIDMRMGKDKHINIASGTEARSVQFEGLFPYALEKPAIQKDTMIVDFKQMLRAGNGFRRAVEGNFHDFSLYALRLRNKGIVYHKHRYHLFDLII